MAKGFPSLSIGVFLMQYILPENLFKAFTINRSGATLTKLRACWKHWSRFDFQVISWVFYPIYPFVFILIMLIYDHNQREEKKREVMDSEVTLQRMQMKYKVHVFFCILIVLNLLTIKSWSLVLIPVFAWNLDWIACLWLWVRIQNLFTYIWDLLNIGKSMRILPFLYMHLF